MTAELDEDLCYIVEWGEVGGIIQCYQDQIDLIATVRAS